MPKWKEMNTQKFKMKEMKAQKASLVRKKEEKVRPKKNRVASAQAPHKAYTPRRPKPW